MRARANGRMRARSSRTSNSRSPRCRSNLQRIVTMDAMRAALEVKDYAGAAKRARELDVIGVPAEIAPALRGAARPACRGARQRQGRARRLQVRGRLVRPQVGGRGQAARGRAAAEARRDHAGRRVARARDAGDDLARRLHRGQDAADAVADLCRERALSATRSTAARTATRLAAERGGLAPGAGPASALFTQIFLGPKGDELPPIDALGMFYEFRELTPIGRRGDELIRRLADRLAVDRPARPGRRAPAVPGRPAPRRRGARPGRRAPRP